MAAINAFKSIFPFAEISGCYFHLGQSAWRKIRDLGLAEKYHQDPAFAIRVRKFLALAFVPPTHVHHYMRMLRQDEAHKNDGLLQDFAKYFTDMYVGTEFDSARFEYTSWNMYQRIKDKLPRTNNSLEGWHGAFARDIKNHPDIVKLSEKYRQEQHTREIFRNQHVSGRGLRKPEGRAKYAKVTKYLQDQIRKFDDHILYNVPYLEEIAKVMTIQVKK